MFWHFSVWINCSSDLKKFSNSRPSASNFKSFSRSLEQFFLTVGHNNFGNKIPFQNFYHFYKTFDHSDEKLFLRITLTIVKVSSFLRWAILIVFNDARTTKLCRLDYFFNLDIFLLKISTYEKLLRNYIFVPIAVETFGSWGPRGLEFIKEIGRKIQEKTGNKNATSHIIQAKRALLEL